MEPTKETIQESKEELNKILESASDNVNEAEQKFEEIAKDNEQLRSEMNEDELKAFDKAREILESETNESAEAQAKAMREAAATALVRDTIRQFNLMHKVSRTFLEMPEEHGLENFLRENLKGCKGGKAKAVKTRKLTIEYNVLRNGHKQFQEGVTLQNVTDIFFKDFRPCQSDAEFHKATDSAITELIKISGQPNIKSLLLNLRYCAKFPMNCLYGYFAMAINKYCHKIGGFDSRQLVKSIIKNLSTIAVVAVASKGLGEEEIKKLDLSVIETFASAVEAFDKKLSEYISEKKEG